MAEPPGPPTVSVPCPACGRDVTAREAFCPACGADLGVAALRGAPSGGGAPWALFVVLVLVAAGIVALWQRFRAVGPGPDLSTTARWLVLGDGGRRAQLATLSRAYETARAVARLTLDRGAPASLDEVGWRTIQSYSNADYRGFVSLVVWAADASAVRGRLAWMLAVDGRDGWGRPWRSTLTRWPGSGAPDGFFPGVVAAGAAPPRGRALFRLTLVSAGPDARFDTPDDLTLDAVFPAPRPVPIGDPALEHRREEEIERGQVWVRVSGSDYDLIDARLLSEFYLTSVHGE